MSAALRLLGQAAVLLSLMAAIAWLASAPAYVHFPADRALVKLSFAHAAARKGECRRLTPAEIAKLPPNMRRPLDCPRERIPVVVELELDGAVAYAATVRPGGLSGDGPSRVYVKLPVAVGAHDLTVRLRDTARASGFDHERTARVVLAPRQNFVIDFRPEAGGFVFR